MTYAELFASVGGILPPTVSYAIEVQTFRHISSYSGPYIVTIWSISVLPDDGACTRADGKTPEAALEAIVAKLGPTTDSTGIGELVGDASVGDASVGDAATTPGSQ